MTSPETSAAGAIDTYLSALAARLTIAPEQRATILEEIRGHLQEAAAAQQSRGVASAEAESYAVTAFGPVATAARALNAELPVYWDLRRMALGVLLGALSIWLVWTLVTFPFVVQLAAEHRLTSGTTPGELLFMASPLSFGLFYALRDGPWTALLILALFGAIAFVLGSRASSGWRAGLAFVLGVVVGMPFLPLAFVIHDPMVTPLGLLPIVIPIWLLVPYAIIAARLGARYGCASEARALRRPPSAARLLRGVSPVAHRPRTSPASALIGLVLLLALLGVNGWSVVRAFTPAPAATIPVSQQLATAQRSLPFTIRQPSYLPAGLSLTRIDIEQAWCGRCAIDLEYHDAHGGWLSLTEIPHTLPVGAPSASPASLAISVSTMTSFSYHPVWWLGGQDTSERQTSLTWNDGALEYFLGSNSAWPAETLKQVAISLYQQ